MSSFKRYFECTFQENLSKILLVGNSQQPSRNLSDGREVVLKEYLLYQLSTCPSSKAVMVDDWGTFAKDYIVLLRLYSVCNDDIQYPFEAGSLVNTRSRSQNWGSFRSIFREKNLKKKIALSRQDSLVLLIRSPILFEQILLIPVSACKPTKSCFSYSNPVCNRMGKLDQECLISTIPWQ